MVTKLIRIYTPFICALVAIIHGVFYLTHIGYGFLRVCGEFTGHSFIVILYFLATSRHMCKWYKRTLYLLMSIHIVNLAHIFGWIESYTLIYAGLVINILAVICFLIYRVTKGITKLLC